MIKTYSDTAKTLFWTRVEIPCSCLEERSSSFAGMVVSKFVMPPEMREWLENNFGSKGGYDSRWLPVCNSHSREVDAIMFKYRDDAILFKMTWF